MGSPAAVKNNIPAYKKRIIEMPAKRYHAALVIAPIIENSMARGSGSATEPPGCPGAAWAMTNTGKATKPIIKAKNFDKLGII